MWELYRKSLIPTQGMILVICIVLFLALKVPLLTVFIYLAIMEGFAVIGAAWGKRLKGKVDRENYKKEWTLR